MTFVELIVISILLVSIDFVYLNFIKKYFSNQIYIIQGTPLKINYISAIICYIFIVNAVYYFIINPKRSIVDAFLLGIVIYGIFETTNMTLFKKWKWTTVIIDTIWGGILFALTTYLFTIINK